MPQPTPEDFVAISQLLYGYAAAVDGKDLESLRDLFTEDAIIHYDLLGGAKKPLDEMIPWLQGTLQMFQVTQHAVSNPVIEVDEDGNTARSRCYLIASHEQVGQDGRRTVFIDKGAYHDVLRRTPAGWRIERRTLRRFMMHGDFQAPDSVESTTEGAEALLDPH